MAEEIVKPPETKQDPPEPRESRKSVTCEFCDCVLDSSGSYKKLSERARTLRDLEEKYAELKKECDSFKAEKDEREKERIARETNNHDPGNPEKKKAFFELH